MPALGNCSVELNNMSRRVFKWVSDLIKTKPDQTTIRAMSVIGYSVIERYQNGRIQNDKLLFTAEQYLNSGTSCRHWVTALLVTQFVAY
jgi:hypothetical protein